MDTTPLVVYGPTGISRMMDHIAEAFAPLNADTRAALKVTAHELKSPGVAYKDMNVTVRVFGVLHKDGPAFGLPNRDRRSGDCGLGRHAAL
jgi:hypothetical protein